MLFILPRRLDENLHRCPEIVFWPFSFLFRFLLPRGFMAAAGPGAPAPSTPSWPGHQCAVSKLVVHGMPQTQSLHFRQSISLTNPVFKQSLTCSFPSHLHTRLCVFPRHTLKAALFEAVWLPSGFALACFLVNPLQ